ncbi:N-acetylmuramoyl-L-alanine amidase [Salipaludibacillus sp. CF4.18]|uniref:N-acetylmuramoyl-L-alanine amidase n=1 Tax=Salipaludibacillus sp. CF4.18 TaxID=3373081 RepID=UPI003EE4F5B0
MIYRNYLYLFVFTLFLTLFTVQMSVEASSSYIEVHQGELTVYDNSSGKLVEVGSLTKGQVFPLKSKYGNWHKISFGGKDGFIWASGTSELSKTSVKNLNNGKYSDSQDYFKATKELEVYDNSSGSLEKMGALSKDIKYPIVSDYGNWYRILFADRIGYVNKSGVEIPFTTADKYLRMNVDKAPIYDNSSGKLVKVGTLERGQVYPRVSDYGNWHRIQYNSGYGYVWKEATTPVHNPVLPSESKSQYSESKNSLVTTRDTSIYDNTSGSLVKFAEIEKANEYSIVSDYGNWYRILLADRIGYVSKLNVEVLYGDEKKQGIVNVTNNLNVRNGPGSENGIIGSLSNGENVQIAGESGDWYIIDYQNGIGYIHSAYVNLYNNERKVVVIDAGHGGSDPGAVAFNAKEKDLVFKVALLVAEQMRDTNIEIVLTRDGDYFIPLSDRANIANGINADLFISIHANAAGSTAAVGIETFWDDSYSAAKSKELASITQAQLLKKLGLRNRGVKQSGFNVIRNSKMPSVLLELGFMTNYGELQKMLTKEFQEDSAEAIKESIDLYFSTN